MVKSLKNSAYVANDRKNPQYRGISAISRPEFLFLEYGIKNSVPTIAIKEKRYQRLTGRPYDL